MWGSFIDFPPGENTFQQYVCKFYCKDCCNSFEKLYKNDDIPEQKTGDSSTERQTSIPLDKDMLLKKRILEKGRGFITLPDENGKPTVQTAAIPLDARLPTFAIPIYSWQNNDVKLSTGDNLLLSSMPLNKQQIRLRKACVIDKGAVQRNKNKTPMEPPPNPKLMELIEEHKQRRRDIDPSSDDDELDRFGDISIDEEECLSKDKDGDNSSDELSTGRYGHTDSTGTSEKGPQSPGDDWTKRSKFGKTMHKSRVLKFHQYNGPPNSKNQPTISETQTIIDNSPPPDNASSDQHIEQQQYLLQWSLEAERNGLSPSLAPIEISNAVKSGLIPPTQTGIKSVKPPLANTGSIIPIFMPSPTMTMASNPVFPAQIPVSSTTPSPITTTTEDEHRAEMELDESPDSVHESEEPHVDPILDSINSVVENIKRECTTPAELIEAAEAPKMIDEERLDQSTSEMSGEMMKPLLVYPNQTGSSDILDLAMAEAQIQMLHNGLPTMVCPHHQQFLCQEQQAGKKSRRKSSKPKKRVEDNEDQPQPPTQLACPKNDKDILNEMRVIDLKQECRMRGLMVSGPKPRLIERLQKHFYMKNMSMALNNGSTAQDFLSCDSFTPMSLPNDALPHMHLANYHSMSQEIQPNTHELPSFQHAFPIGEEKESTMPKLQPSCDPTNNAGSTDDEMPVLVPEAEPEKPMPNSKAQETTGETGLIDRISKVYCAGREDKSKTVLQKRMQMQIEQLQQEVDELKRNFIGTTTSPDDITTSHKVAKVPPPLNPTPPITISPKVRATLSNFLKAHRKLLKDRKKSGDDGKTNEEVTAKTKEPLKKSNSDGQTKVKRSKPSARLKRNGSAASTNGIPKKQTKDNLVKTKNKKDTAKTLSRSVSFPRTSADQLQSISGYGDPVLVNPYIHDDFSPLKAGVLQQTVQNMELESNNNDALPELEFNDSLDLANISMDWNADDLNLSVDQTNRLIQDVTNGLSVEVRESTSDGSLISPTDTDPYKRKDSDYSSLPSINSMICSDLSPVKNGPFNLLGDAKVSKPIKSSDRTAQICDWLDMITNNSSDQLLADAESMDLGQVDNFFDEFSFQMNELEFDSPDSGIHDILAA